MCFRLLLLGNLVLCVLVVRLVNPPLPWCFAIFEINNSSGIRLYLPLFK